MIETTTNIMNNYRPITPTRETDTLKMNEMSMREREIAMQDLHGVSDIPNEDDVAVQASLRELRQELNLHDSIATEDDELLMFLRAEGFDTLKAAARFNRFAAFQKKLFGKQEKLKYSDLSEEDLKYLQSGFMQLLPQRDRAGRAIIMCIGALKQQFKTPVESDLRCLSFLASKAAEDEDTQKRGIVVIYYGLAQKVFDGRNNRPLHFLRAFEDLPARVVACHFCYDSASMKPLLNLLTNSLDKRMVGRFRSHFGQHAECQYNLVSFGIPKECLPVDGMGQVDLTNHMMLLKTIQLEEHQKENPMLQQQQQLMAQVACTRGEKFLIPSQMDIILGRGQHAKNTPGHMRFKLLLDQQQSRYESAEKSQKTRVADDILKELKSGGCRFLKPRAAGGWLQISDDAGREKINHAFRNLRSTAKKATRAASPTTCSPPSKRRKMIVEKKTYCAPASDEMFAPLPLFAASASSLGKKEALDEAFIAGFPFNLLSNDLLSNDLQVFAL